MSEKVAVCHSVDELEELLNGLQNKYFCLYLAHKDDAGWDKSTSRVYMNQLWPDFAYIPIDIEKDDNESLEKLYELANRNPSIVAINQTQPHKSNPVIIKLLGSKQQNIDTLIKDNSGKLKPLNLNGPSFVEWLKTELNNISGYTYIVIGVGGVGEPIARELAKYKPAKLLLVDPKDKSILSVELQPSEYFTSLNQIGEIAEPVILINAAGKEGADGNNELSDAFKKHKSLIYIDLRPQLTIPEVEAAKELGLKSYTGYGMNTRNDYTLVETIAEKINKQPPSYQDFKELVAAAS